MTKAFSTAARYVFACAVIGMMAGCGNSSDTSDGAASAAPSASAVQPTAEACGNVDRITEAVAEFGVTDISIIGQCTAVAIETNLADDASGAATGRRICTAAATVAYTDDVNSIAVTAADGSELAIGIKGASCIGD
ncbi:hypothetical protein [Nocardia sp. NPDC005366]|uniref:hypothetical protein n=1 Tax=Nocardia sp. NPDC005366 TaxID=3156878 RepID=UPI0033A7C27B